VDTMYISERSVADTASRLLRKLRLHRRKQATLTRKLHRLRQSIVSRRQRPSLLSSSTVVSFRPADFQPVIDLVLRSFIAVSYLCV